MTARPLIIGDAFVVDEIDHLPQPTDVGSSVVSQTDGVLSRAALARVTFSRMSAAFAIQVIV